MIMRYITKLLSLLILVLVVSACSQPQLVSLAGRTMGTTYHIKLVPNKHLPDEQLLQAEIDMALERVNNQMSTYRPASELSQFNLSKAGQRTRVSQDTILVLQEAIKLYEQTDGALDVTLGPLINLWGFGPEKRPIKVPSKLDIDIAKAKMGVEGVSIEPGHLVKHNSDLYVDLSSIAKGFGVDVVAAVLDKYQVSGYLVEVGGEISVKGHKLDGQPWRVAIEQPDATGREVSKVISLNDMAMATSGDYRNYFEDKGVRFSHLIDPRTGYPINHKLASVTVLHPSSMSADGYATAMMVMGTEASLALASELDLAIMLIEKQPHGYQIHYSDAFLPYVQ
ncbi:FAD:protein FMN transferase [Shewanella sp. WXL01]|uniref:FAD:protein FMN transferase n=1 Tax=Shewanella sp. WXL01 TaxID=2709721 RepID=UPI0014386788|nr:FAD:protein FMN transferase [Shewanella sp. WXL01]NKF49678.1 FAD:protein FMN transferase [Shewanella sp. WXL01]